MNRFAASMPGNTGDSLYALPTIREIYRQTGMKCDFYTSSKTEIAESLWRYQDCIADFIIPKEYTIERTDMGTQPWYIPIDESKYSAVYQLGYRSVPDRPLHQFMALYAGIDKPLKIEYNYPAAFTSSSFVALSPRGETSYKKLFQEVADILQRKGHQVVVIGGPHDNVCQQAPLLADCTGLDLLDTVSLLSKAKGFFGMMSTQLVLANGFSYAKVAPHDGIHWDLRHVVQSSSNFYPVNPSAEEVVSLLGL